MRCSSEADRGGSLHRLGDGDHLLPVRWLIGGRLEPLSSRGCVLFLFVCWAQEHGFDPVEIHARACPDQPRLRPDQLLFFRQWTDVDGAIGLELLCRDLCAVGESELVRAILEVGAGRWQPSPAYSHWVVTDSGLIVGEARELDPPGRPDEFGQHFCFVRLFAMPEMAEWGYTDAAHLHAKQL